MAEAAAHAPRSSDQNQDSSENASCASSCLLNGFLSVLEKSLESTAARIPERRDASEHLYTPLRDWQIRLLRLRPGHYGSPLIADLQVADLLHDEGVLLHASQERVFYDSLSHCWGPQDFLCPLLLRDGTFPITRSVHDALQRIRCNNRDRYLWVDAVCINQENDAEKSQQVSKMLTIFKKASRVIIWLGEVGEHTKLVEEYFSRAASSSTTIRNVHTRPDNAEDRESNHSTLCDQHASKVIGGINDLLHRDWYDRAWIKQEIWAAREPTMICGNFQLPKDLLGTGPSSKLEMLALRASNIHRPRLQQIYTRMKHLQTSLVSASPQLLLRAEQSDIRNPLLQNEEKFALDLINVLRRSVGSKCTDHRDHIYAFIGMSTAPKASKSSGKPDHPLRIDYSRSACEVFRDVALYFIMRERDLSVLYLDATYAADVDGTRLPSWVPDWRQPTQPMMIILMHLDAMYRRAKLTLEALLNNVRRDASFSPTSPSNPLALRLRGRALAILRSCDDCVQRHGYELTQRYSINNPEADHFQQPVSGRVRQHTIARYTVTVGKAQIAFSNACPCETNGAMVDDWSILFQCEWDAPATARKGDIIAILEGGYTPLLLRSASPTEYCFLGPTLCTHVRLAPRPLSSSRPSLLGVLNGSTGDPGRLSFPRIVNDIQAHFVGHDGTWRRAEGDEQSFEII
ncbi:hypothetical protein AC578_6948 [Pseudocercospora eumusae]|uniref:Heterokaryon incompatibility domain-containing protein n=1 Tax=Pseudocercospora eumusae TaxID=321146 RepID=A0A139H9B2_9PEZI|nr:hypothetical protein AC578_6948 [Pseudocercospora eumusae]